MQVDVCCLQVDRGEHDSLAQRGVEIRDVPGNPRLDPVGVPLAKLLRPRAVASVELPGGVALHAPGQFLELDPEEPGAVGRARRVNRQGLTDDDGRLRRQQAALGLVHCT